MGDQDRSVRRSRGPRASPCSSRRRARPARLRRCRRPGRLAGRPTSAPAPSTPTAAGSTAKVSVHVRRGQRSSAQRQIRFRHTNNTGRASGRDIPNQMVTTTVRRGPPHHSPDSRPPSQNTPPTPPAAQAHRRTQRPRAPRTRATRASTRAGRYVISHLGPARTRAAIEGFFVTPTRIRWSCFPTLPAKSGNNTSDFASSPKR
jgi:hypothetical protein